MTRSISCLPNSFGKRTFAMFLLVPIAVLLALGLALSKEAGFWMTSFPTFIPMQLKISIEEEKESFPSTIDSRTPRHEYLPHCEHRINNDNYEAPEPFEYLHNCCEDCNPEVPESPDPLVSVTWNLEQVATKDDGFEPLQIYRTRDPVALYTIPSTASVVMPTASISDTSDKPRLIIFEDCTVVMDWGSERAAWFELLSEDDMSIATASVSEYNRPYPGKTRSLKKYGNHTYRLETNDELYEGVRFTFLHVKFPTTNSSTTSRELEANRLIIDDFSVVSKVKAIDYTSSFRSSNSLLTKAWYWGAYGVRLNVERDQLNSILIERGDRVAIQGDGHPTIATALTVFYSKEMKRLLANVVNATDSAHKHVVDDGIMPYPLYWCLSAIDYYWATTGDNDDDDDAAFIQQLVDDIRVLLDKRIADFLDPNLDITWFGWDDRIGNGWCFHANNDVCTREALLAFAGLVIRLCNDLVGVLLSLGDTQLANHYKSQSQDMVQLLRSVPEFPSGFGVHAAAYAINAKIATPEEIQEYWMGTADGANTLNNAVTVCSFSQFNQYWILQAYGNMEGGMEHALKSIDLCWGPMMELSTGGCFWELSSPEWLHLMKEGDQAPHLPSYCHPWASGVTPWLSRVVGGVLPLTRGYKEFVAMPHVSERYPSVDTTTATPYGPIVVSARLTKMVESHGITILRSAYRESLDSVFVFDATIECKTQGLFGLRKSIVTEPLEGGEILEVPIRLETLKVNGIPIDPDEILEQEVVDTLFESSSIGGNNLRSKEYVYLKLGEGNGEGRHAVTATYQSMDNDPISNSGKSSSNNENRGQSTSTDTTKDVSPFPIRKYPAIVGVPADRNSQGDGLLKYGKDGYSLRGCNIDRWPRYVQNVTIVQHGFPGWVVPDESPVGYSETDPVYLPLNDTMRGLGTVGIDDQGGGDINCILIDVTLAAKETTTYFLSVYFVALRPGNKHAIRVMDGETYDVIAPTTLIEDYEGGVWWTLETNRSVRLKMMDIEGIHISAVAFSSNLDSQTTTLVE